MTDADKSVTVQDAQGGRRVYYNARHIEWDKDPAWLSVLDSDKALVALYAPGQWTCVEMTWEED